MNCLDCDKELSGKRVDARFCNDTCKKRWQRKQKPAGKRGRPKSSAKGEAPSNISQTKVPQGTDVPPQRWVDVMFWKSRALALASVTDLGAGEGFCATTPMASGCMAAGATHDDALKNLNPALEDWMNLAMKMGMKQPPMIGTSDKVTSPTVALKQRTKARILAKKGKSGGPSISLPASSDLPVPDVPPVLVKRSFIPAVEDEPTLQERRDMLREILTDDPPPPEGLGFNYQKLPYPNPHDDPSTKAYMNNAWKTPKLHVENHGKTNDLARQSILSKVPVPKLDPNSDAATLARLNACQLKKPAKGKEGA